METVEFTLPAESWKGIVTKFPPDTKLVGADQFTLGSYNFITDSNGCITKRPDSIEYNTSAFPTPPKDQYEAVFSSGIRHLLIVENGNLRYSSGGGTFSAVTGGTYTAGANMEFALYKNRVYFGNGIDDPQVYDLTTSYGGVGYTAPAVKDMGCQIPVSAPSTAIAAGGSVPVGAHTYKVTFLYYDAEESNGGPASGVATTTGGNQTVNLSSIPVGGYGVTARKIYRDDNDGNYVLVGTLSDNTTTIFSDVSALGTTPIPTNNALPPLFSLIITHRDRLWMAGITDDPSRIYWSEAGQPNIVRINNSILCNPRDPITALVVYNDRVLVFNRNSMGQVLGSTSADFRYSEISPSVGCVDTRSIQIRTIRGVPTLVWLSNNNFFQFNGSSINNISTEIEDQIQLNIQQAVQVKGKQTQTTQSEFSAGTASPGIDLNVIPGSITTKGYTGTNNPTKLWDTEAEWEAGTTTNIATNNGNIMSVPTQYAPTIDSGAFSNTLNVANTIRTPLSTDFTGESHSSTGLSTITARREQAQAFIPSRTGTLTSVTIPFYQGFTSVVAQYQYRVYTDNFGSPNSLIGSSATFGFSQPSSTPVLRTVSEAMSVNLTGGVKYWISIELVASTGGGGMERLNQSSGWTASNLAYYRVGPTQTGSWITEATQIVGTYTFISSAISTAGLWTGPTYDTYSDTAIAATIAHMGVFPSGCTSDTTVEAANDAGFTSGLLTQTVANLNGSNVISLSGRRYWRVKVQLSTTDNRNTAQIGPITLKFNTTGTWISEVIDHSNDITSLDALIMNASIPAGTATVEIATSPDNLTYSPYTSLGSATPQRYSKVRIILTTDAGNTITPTVNNVRLDWSLTANLISSVIDTGSTPAGFDIFQANFDLNGGTVLYDVRTASSIPGLSLASWVPVTNGAFISATPNQYIQYRATISSSANAVPIINSVTINWLIQNVAGIRVASLFHNNQYYLAAAEYGSNYNNVLFVYDEDNTWKFWRGMTINTLGTFFTDAYFGSSTIGKLYKMFQPISSVIDMDVRSKAFSHEVGDETKTKHLRKLVLKYKNTGCRITPSYSIDGGVTFLDLKDITTGLSYIDTGTDGKIVLTRFVPNGATIGSGKSLMLRLYNNDNKEVQIHSMRATCWINPREVL